MKASLKEFIQTGALGALRPGDTRQKVEEYLGPPREWHINGKTPLTSDIWKYGDVEFYFNVDALWMIFMDDFETPKGDQTLELDPWIISGQLTSAQFEEHLRASGTTYRKEDFPFTDNGVRLITTAGTTLTFSSEDAANPTLRVVHRQI